MEFVRRLQAGGALLFGSPNVAYACCPGRPLGLPRGRTRVFGASRVLSLGLSRSAVCLQRVLPPVCASPAWGTRTCPARTCGCVSSRVILPADVLFTFSFLQQLSVLVPGFVLGGGRICGYKTCTEASFRSERGSLCAGRYFALCSKFPFEKCQIILVNTVENPPALGLRQEQKQKGAGCREAARRGGFFLFHSTNRSAVLPLLQSKEFL